MRTISKEELKMILSKHKHYIAEDVRGWESMQADLSGVKLRNADLGEANLKYANLRGADLRGADLSEAKLNCTDLRGADLSQSDLVQANLRLTFLSEANFSEAYLMGACLRNADLNGANLRGAKLRGADLSGANLRGANLIDVDLRGAILMDANLSEAKLPDPEIMNSICPLVCPEEGAFIGWKKADVMLSGEDGFPIIIPVIVELQIIAHALRSSATSRKCRCDRALVLDIQSLGGESLPTGTVAYSHYDPTFTYEAGQKLYIANFDDDRWKECSAGIHFFITRQEAVDY